MAPFPSFPQIHSADLGEGEWKVGMKRKTEKSLDERQCIVANLDSVQARLASLQQLQSQTQEELDALSSSPSVASGIPSAEGATARSPRSAAEWEGGAFKREL